MKIIHTISLIAGSILLLLSQGCWRGDVSPEFREAVTNRGRSEILFDPGWKFHRGDTVAAESVGFNDSSWRIVDLPHDWSIEDLPGKESPIDSNAISGIDAGYLVGGTGWYRKEFSLPSSLKHKHVMVRFDGVYMNSDVWINGEPLGNHPYGYTSFRYDITHFLKPGKKNVIAIKIRNEGRNSRWYSGSGIYRHVWFTVTSPVHLDPWKISVTTPLADSSRALIKITTGLINDSEIDANTLAITYIYDQQGRMLAQSANRNKIEPAKEALSATEFNLSIPALWSPDNPVLYSSATELFVEDREGRKLFLDRVETRFGIRDVKISSEQGFILNGKRIVLKGGCMHHDNGPLGAAAFDRA
jgi:beta-galactosidase